MCRVDWFHGSNCVHIHFLSHPFPNIPHNSCKDLLVAFPKSSFQYGQLASGTDSIAPDPVRFETPGDVLGSSNLTRHQSTMSLAALPAHLLFNITNPCLLAVYATPVAEPLVPPLLATFTILPAPRYSSPAQPRASSSPAPSDPSQWIRSQLLVRQRVDAALRVTDPGNVEQDVDINTEALAAGADDSRWGGGHQ
jgi:hypothetical protein